MVEELKKKIEECESKLDSENDNYLEKLVHSYPELNLNDERILFNLYKISNDKTYKDIIFKCHLRDVYDTCKVTNDYRADLISEGTLLLYEFIDNYDYKIPYSSFKKALTTRLVVLFNDMITKNDKSLDTKMSTHELACLEEHGKDFTEVVRTPYEKKDKYAALSGIKNNSNKKTNKYFGVDYAILNTRRLINQKDILEKKKIEALKILKLTLKDINSDKERFY